jgi:hypothetical protein
MERRSNDGWHKRNVDFRAVSRNEDRGRPTRQWEPRSSEALRQDSGLRDTPPAPKICWNCDKVGHLFRNCRAPRILKCFNCKKPGVKTTTCNCLQQGKENTTEQRGCESQRSNQALSIGPDNKCADPRPHVKVKVFGREFNSLIDTGSTISLIDDKVARFLERRVKPVAKEIRVAMADNTAVTLKEVFTFPVEINGSTCELTMACLPNLPGEMILGMDAIRSLNLVTFDCTVLEVKPRVYCADRFTDASKVFPDSENFTVLEISPPRKQRNVKPLSSQVNVEDIKQGDHESSQPTGTIPSHAVRNKLAKNLDSRPKTTRGKRRTMKVLIPETNTWKRINIKRLGLAPFKRPQEMENIGSLGGVDTRSRGKAPLQYQETLV